jgi:hypothetical protein
MPSWRAAEAVPAGVLSIPTRPTRDARASSRSPAAVAVLTRGHPHRREEDRAPEEWATRS